MSSNIRTQTRWAWTSMRWPIRRRDLILASNVFLGCTGIFSGVYSTDRCVHMLWKYAVPWCAAHAYWHIERLCVCVLKFRQYVLVLEHWYCSVGIIVRQMPWGTEIVLALVSCFQHINLPLDRVCLNIFVVQWCRVFERLATVVTFLRSWRRG